MNRTIVISANTSWFLHNFHAGLIAYLIKNGYKVVTAAPMDVQSKKLEDLGCKFIPLKMESNGSNPIRDLALLYDYARILCDEKPFAYFSFTVKPNIYGSMAASMLGIPAINNVTGLGTTFINKNIITYVVRLLYSISLRKSFKVFFLNKEDKSFFIRLRMVSDMQADYVAGSGVDLQKFKPASFRSVDQGIFRFLLIARVLKDKGIMEFVEAARMVRKDFPNTEFLLVGDMDTTNPNSISAAKMGEWQMDGSIRYLGKVEDIRPCIEDADCVVLPSYREGVPRSLLEAAAMSRPLIATDVVGCRDVVDDNLNGYLCKERDSVDLAEKMVQMIQLPYWRRAEMGLTGRRKVETYFDEKIVNEKYLQSLNDIS